VKLRAYLEKEMRKWERTFPDELWIEFGRLTNWKGSVTQRPKYWGHLVIQLIYEYLDPDVAQWLKENAPAPRKGQNYHQWLSAQYGLKKLIEHIWMVVGIARTCYNMDELKQKMRQMFGKGHVQYNMFMPTPEQATPLQHKPLTPKQEEAEKAELGKIIKVMEDLRDMKDLAEPPASSSTSDPDEIVDDLMETASTSVAK
jgi:hypothetical protein